MVRQNLRSDRRDGGSEGVEEGDKRRRAICVSVVSATPSNEPLREGVFSLVKRVRGHKKFQVQSRGGRGPQNVRGFCCRRVRSFLC